MSDVQYASVVNGRPRLYSRGDHPVQARIRELWDTHTNAAIARIVGFSPTRIRTLALEIGLARIPPGRVALDGSSSLADHPLAERVRELRIAGLSLKAIARTLHVDPSTVRHLCCRLGLSTAPIAPPQEASSRPPTRPALPPGDPVSWGAITAGTILSGAPYSHEVRR